MKFGIREICDVVFKTTADNQRVGTKLFAKAGQPAFHIDTAKTSTLEQATTTVYAQGGRGNTRLIAWEGEKTLTFTVEDALLSPVSFSMLSGAGLISSNKETVHVHMTTTVQGDVNGKIDLTDALGKDEVIDAEAPVFVMALEKDGSLTGAPLEGGEISEDGKSITIEGAKNTNVMVDYYVSKEGTSVAELQIDAENFAGNYYVEASTLFRNTDGKDMPAEITFPNVKIQSNFTFTMASTGDPSTFTFTMDAFPGYTIFDGTKKVLCVIQIVNEEMSTKADRHSVMRHTTTDAEGHIVDLDPTIDKDIVDNDSIDANNKSI